MTLDENCNLIVVKPKRRSDVVDIALKFRKAFGITEDALHVDVLAVLEFRLQAFFDDNITFCVPDKWHREEEAYYDARKNIIYIRADVYDKAAAGDGRARFTIMHEISHCILFKIWGTPHTMPLADIADISDATLKSMDPEWQANTFTGAFLCKPDIIRNMKIYDIETLCGVSEAAAETAYRHSHGIPYNSFALTMDDFADWSWTFSMSQLCNEVEQGVKRE